MIAMAGAQPSKPAENKKSEPPKTANLPGVAVNVAQITNLPEDYVGKQVKLLNCQFRGTSTSWVTIFKLSDMVGFAIQDENQEFFKYCLYPKTDAAKVLALKRDQKLNLSGRIVKKSGVAIKQHFLVVDTIQVVE